MGWLRKRGIKSMEKRAADAVESLLALNVSGNAGAIVELRAETDFVTRSKIFQQLVVSLAHTAAAQKGTESLAEAPLVLFPGADQAQLKEKAGKSCGEALLELGSVLGERIELGKSWRLAAAEGSILSGYVHPKSREDLAGTGRMAALVSSTGSSEEAEEQKLRAAGAQLARHIVAMQPRFVSVESIPENVLEKEKSTVKQAHLAQMDPKKAAKVDEKIMDKVINGKMNKFFSDTVLLRQELLMPQTADDAKPPSVEKWLKEGAKSMGVKSVEVDAFELACL